MIKEDETVKMRRFEKVYRTHVDKIYKICLYYLRDEKKAGAITEKVFFNYYIEHGGTHSKHTFGRLVNETKKLLISELSGNVELEDMKECTTNGEN